MAINFLNNLSLNQNQLELAAIQNVGSDPSSGVLGQIIFNTSEDALKVCTTASTTAAVYSEVGGGVTSVTTTDGTFINLTPNSATAGAVTVTADLSATGTASSSTFLRGDNQWATPPQGDITDVTAGTYLNGGGSSGNVTLNHDSTSRTDSTAATSLSAGDTFDAFTVLTSNATGHVTDSTVTTYTLPNDDNDTYDFDTTSASDGATLTLDENSGTSAGTFAVRPNSTAEIAVTVTTGNAGVAAIGFPSGGFTAPDGSVATTQANSDNSTKLATTAYVDSMIGTVPAGLVFQGTWDASTNTPTLASGTGTTGHFYIVSVAGNTNLDGITDWAVGDWAVFVEQGATDQWEKIDNSSVLDGSGVAGQVSYWSSTSELAGDAGMTYDATNNVLTVDSGTSTEWNSAYNNTVTGISVTGTTTKTITLTQQDTGTLTATFTDNDSGGTVTSVGSTSPITIDTVAGGSSTSTPTVGILTATGSQIGAGNVAAGSGISISYSSGTATISSSGNPSGAKISLDSSATNITKSSAGGITTFEVDVTGVFSGTKPAEDCKVEVIDNNSNFATVYPEVQRSSGDINVLFSEVGGAPADGDYSILVIKVT